MLKSSIKLIKSALSFGLTQVRAKVEDRLDLTEAVRASAYERACKVNQMYRSEYGEVVVKRQGAVLCVLLNDLVSDKTCINALEVDDGLAILTIDLATMATGKAPIATELVWNLEIITDYWLHRDAPKPFAEVMAELDALCEEPVDPVGLAVAVNPEPFDQVPDSWKNGRQSELEQRTREHNQRVKDKRSTVE